MRRTAKKRRPTTGAAKHPPDLSTDRAMAAMKRGRPTDGRYPIIASAAYVLMLRGQTSKQAIAVAEEVCQRRWPTASWSLNIETVRRTIRRIANRKRALTAFPVDFYAELLAASDPRSEPRSDEAATLLAKTKINLREFQKAIKKTLSEIEIGGKTVH